MKYIIIAIMLFSLLAGVISGLDAQEWPAWRGPDRDGTLSGVSWNPRALDGGADVLWRINVGQGYSGISVRGRFLYTMGNDGSRDTIFCIDTRSGREIWFYSYPAARGSYSGPRATPVIDGNSLYTISRHGKLISLNAANGRLEWEVDVVREHGASSPGWDFSTSVVIHNNSVIINAGTGGMAFDKSNGRLIWSNGRGRGGYATPVIFSLEGSDYAAIFSRNELVIVEAETGRKRWSYPWQTRSDVNAADPIVSGNRIFISSGYNRGAALLEIRAGGIFSLWESRVLENHFSSSILLDGFIYGVHGQAGSGRGILKAVELATGRERWSSNTGMGSLIALNDKLVLINEQGTLIVAEADPSRFRSLSQASGIIPRLVWTPPSFADGMIYLRNDRGDVVCVDMR
jgi:outer membrane protein assembly factor BamB